MLLVLHWRTTPPHCSSWKYPTQQEQWASPSRNSSISSGCSVTEWVLGMLQESSSWIQILWNPSTFYKTLRQCMAEYLLEHGAIQKMGGQGHIIEVDESKFGKRKYNRGRRVVGKWVLGGYCRTTDECFLVECLENRRYHHTLIRLIKQNVAPGTTILTDNWKGYNALSRNGYNHLVINHWRVFVDPVTGVHTNTLYKGM